MRILSFDIGIKNLAWCLLDKTVKDSENGDCTFSGKLIGLANTNIMELDIEADGKPGVNKAEDKKLCLKSDCKIAPSFSIGERGFCCRRHIPKDFSFLKNPDSNDIALAIPNLSHLKKLLTTEETNEAKVGRMRRDCVINILRRRIAFPLSRKATKKAVSMGPEQLHDAIRTFCHMNWGVFQTANVVLLENQPVFKNPHMKTVQILLFGTLRNMFADSGKPPPFHFIHAGKKTSGAGLKKGDEGYAERKAKSEDRTEQLFSEGKVCGAEFVDAWRGAKKKSDMADVVCMCWDF